MNKVVLIGNLGADPELRHIANGAAVCNFSLATTKHKGSGEDRQSIPVWHRVVAWEKTADLCHRYLTKGSKVVVEGRIEYREWTDKDGVKRTSAEIHAVAVEFLSSQKAPSQGTSEHPTFADDDIPF